MRRKADARGDDPAGPAREAALRLLARREHARRELHAKLAARGFSEDLIEVAVMALGEAGLQSDARFAEGFARQRAERGYGPRRIDAELRQRGVEAGLVARAFDALDADFSAIARAFYQRRYPDPASDYRERARRARAMARRGFAPEHYRDLIDGEDPA